MNYNRALKAEISKSRMSVTTIIALIEAGAHPGVKTKKSKNDIFSLAAKNHWYKANYLKIIAASVSSGKLWNSDFTRGLKLYLLHTDEMDFDILRAFLEAGADPRVKFNGEDWLLTYPEVTTWSRQSYLKLIQICQSTKKLHPIDFSRGLAHYLDVSERMDLVIVEAFLKAGADPKVIYQGKSWLLTYPKVSDWSVKSYIKLIELCQATTKLRPNDFSEGLAHYLDDAESARLSVIAFFLAAGAAVDTKDKNGDSVLVRAAKKQWKKASYLQLIALCYRTGKLSEKERELALYHYISSYQKKDEDILKGLLKPSTVQYEPPAKPAPATKSAPASKPASATKPAPVAKSAPAPKTAPAVKSEPAAKPAPVIRSVPPASPGVAEPVPAQSDEVKMPGLEIAKGKGIEDSGLPRGGLIDFTGVIPVECDYYKLLASGKDTSYQTPLVPEPDLAADPYLRWGRDQKPAMSWPKWEGAGLLFFSTAPTDSATKKAAPSSAEVVKPQCLLSV